MNNRVFMWSCLVMTFFVACQQAEVENPKAEELPMSISASINNQGENSKSRYAGNDPSDVYFVQDDAIGLFIGPAGDQMDGQLRKVEHHFRGRIPVSKGIAQSGKCQKQGYHQITQPGPYIIGRHKGHTVVQACADHRG